MNSLKGTRIGLAALTIIFLILYGFFSTSGQVILNETETRPSNLQLGFADQEMILGNWGGFHILEAIHYEEADDFHRILFETQLNRSSYTPEAITIPYTIIKGQQVDDKYLITVNFGDTEVADIPIDRSLSLLQADNAPVEEVRIIENSDDTTTAIFTLTDKSLFRAAADNSGTIVIDILK